MSTECPISNRLRFIFNQAVRAVQPEQLIVNRIQYDRTAQTLQISAKSSRSGKPPTIINMADKQCHLVGFGKAVLGMATQLEHLLGDRLSSGLLSVPIGITKNTDATSRIEICEGAANNLPDAAATQNARRILQRASEMRSNNVLIVVVSGGGSALLALPIEPIQIAEKQALCRELAVRQATIGELNAVRRALSQTKGGKLADAACNASALVTLAISDVCGSDDVNDDDDDDELLHVIASGPTIQRSDEERRHDATDALRILTQFGMLQDNQVPESVLRVLEQQQMVSDVQQISAVNPRQSAHIIGSNAIACRAAAAAAAVDQHHPIIPIIVSTRVQGDVAHLAEAYVHLVQIICEIAAMSADNVNTEMAWDRLKPVADVLRINQSNQKFLNHAIRQFSNPILPQSICIIAGGETTVRIRGNGVGGRNQELALRISHLLAQQSSNEWSDRVHFLSAGTDGIDGPTEAAGALASARIGRDGSAHGVNLSEFIEANDSYSFYRRLDGGRWHVMTGNTGTNVMDLHLLLVQPKFK